MTGGAQKKSPNSQGNLPLRRKSIAMQHLMLPGEKKRRLYCFQDVFRDRTARMDKFRVLAFHATLALGAVLTFVWTGGLVWAAGAAVGVW
jgi:hypothetical protein